MGNVTKFINGLMIAAVVLVYFYVNHWAKPEWKAEERLVSQCTSNVAQSVFDKVEQQLALGKNEQGQVNPVHLMEALRKQIGSNEDYVHGLAVDVYNNYKECLRQNGHHSKYVEL
ncbi:hypothetical protein HDE_10411 [Halotydeus destructor]|nr:hypothetical protein HDE_10411 [Halotydeus destructor]